MVENSQNILNAVIIAILPYVNFISRLDRGNKMRRQEAKQTNKTK